MARVMNCGLFLLGHDALHDTLSFRESQPAFLRESMAFSPGPPSANRSLGKHGQRPRLGLGFPGPSCQDVSGRSSSATATATGEPKPGPGNKAMKGERHQRSSTQADGRAVRPRGAAEAEARGMASETLGLSFGGLSTTRRSAREYQDPCYSAESGRPTPCQRFDRSTARSPAPPSRRLVTGANGRVWPVYESHLLPAEIVAVMSGPRRHSYAIHDCHPHTLQPAPRGRQPSRTPPCPGKRETRSCPRRPRRAPLRRTLVATSCLLVSRGRRYCLFSWDCPLVCAPKCRHNSNGLM